MSIRCLLTGVMVLLCPLPVAAQDGVQEVHACIDRNIPKRSSQQTVKLTSVDRIGGQRELRGTLLGIRLADGTRRAKLCINRPPEMRGSEILSIENADESLDTYVYTTELRKPTRVTDEAAGGSVFGTNFSYEDFKRWQLLSRSGAEERLPDAEVDGRPVYVLVTRPAEAAQSPYAKVLSYVDKKTCVVIKSESFESGDRLRKVFTARPVEMLEEAGIYAPTKVEIKDVRGETSTTVAVEDLDVDGEIEERSFEASSLGRHCR